LFWIAEAEPATIQVVSMAKGNHNQYIGSLSRPQTTSFTTSNGGSIITNLVANIKNNRKNTDSVLIVFNQSVYSQY
jgi:hypothetical protein